MEVKKMVIELSSLEDAFGDIDCMALGPLDTLSFDVAPATDRDLAGLAFGDGVVGWVVGEFDSGAPAFLALKRDGDVIL